MIKLGDEVQCRITGFKGIAVSHATCLTGCDRIAVKAPMQKDGKMGEEFWFDLDCLEVLKAGKVKPASVQSPDPAKKGGPPTRSTVSRHR